MATSVPLLSLLVLVALLSPTVAQEDRAQELTPEEQLIYDVLVKRPSGGHRYGFGLGKRSPEPMPAQP